MGFSTAGARRRLFQATDPSAGLADHALAGVARARRQKRASNGGCRFPPSAATQPIGSAAHISPRASESAKSARAEISLALKSDGFTPVAPPAGAGTGLAGWQREAKQRIRKRPSAAKRSRLLRVADGERFVGDLLDIGVNEREEMSGARGAPLPCAVLDKIGESLPIDLTANSRSSVSTLTRPTGVASSGPGSTPRAHRRQKPRFERRPAGRNHTPRSALSRAAAVREGRMGDLLRPRADDRRGHRPPRRQPAGADPWRLGLGQVFAGAGRRPAEARAPVSPPRRAMAHLRHGGRRVGRCGTFPEEFARLKGRGEDLERISAIAAQFKIEKRPIVERRSRTSVCGARRRSSRSWRPGSQRFWKRSARGVAGWSPSWLCADLARPRRILEPRLAEGRDLPSGERESPDGGPGARPQGGRNIKEGTDCPEMIVVPAGRF